jgi:hypothetical protein
LEQCLAGDSAKRIAQVATQKWRRGPPPSQGSDLRLFVIDSPYTVMKSNPLPISLKAIYFRWTYS